MTTSLTRSLTIKYVLTLLLLAGLALANYLILRAQIYSQQRMTAIVNLSGQQRTLLKETALAAQQLVEGGNAAQRPTLRLELKAALKSMETAHHALVQQSGADGATPPKQVKSVYFDAPWLLDTELRNYIAQARALAEDDASLLNESNPHFRYVSEPELSGRLTASLDAVVASYMQEAQNTNQRLQALSAWSLGSTVAVLGLTGWFIFRPMVRQVRDSMDQLEELNDTLEVRVAKRTAELEQRSAALALSESLYRSLVEHLPMCVLRKDLEGRFSFVNERFCQLANQPAEQLIGKTDADLYPATMAEKYQRDDRHVVQNNAVLHDVEQHQTSDGRERFMEVIKAPLRDANSRIMGIQTVFWDVTDRKKAEERALQAERLAAIGQTVTGVAHESRNALQQIQACSRLLEWEFGGDDEVRPMFEDLQKAQDRLRRLFDDLRGYASARKLDLRLTNLQDVIDEAWDALEQGRSSRDVRLEQKADTPNVHATCDPFQLEQVFRNVLENALQACDDPVRLDITFSDSALNGQPSLRIAIRDNGPGLSGDARRRIFEPFYTTCAHGTGLGMAIVKRIVEDHHGQVELGRATNGTEIIISIPRGTK